MQMADLIIGKAGPNLIFESVASQKPFLAISHIPGQEDGNLDIIKDYKLGYVEENPFKAAKLLRSVINDPSNLQQFQAAIAKLRVTNQKSQAILTKTLAQALESLQ